MNSQAEKFKVYVVADAYQWHEISIYPDVYQNWITQIEQNPNEVEFLFMTKMMTKVEYEQSVKDLKTWNQQAFEAAKQNRPKPKLKVVPKSATVLEFPGKKDE